MSTFKLPVIVMMVLLVAGLDPATAQDNPGYNLASSMSDHERAKAFAHMVNEDPYVKKDPELYCTPSHTKFLGMKPNKRAGYVLYCQGGAEFLMIMYPDEAMTVKTDFCWVAVIGDGSCEDDWDILY